MSDPPEESTSSASTWLRLIACSILLVGLAMVQEPGFVVPDTKVDLVEAPGGFLSRALHLWDGTADFGQLQNQAYGYLWPMGPFFALGDLLQVPGWVVQRSWLGLVLVVAFLGVARLSRALGVRSDLACVLGGLAYALSPRMLTVLGPISIEAWPGALAPWVLLPLVIGAERGSARRAAALSALAVAMVGGVNAAATFAVLPLGALWILTRRRGPRRRSLMIWWPLFTLLGTLWWLIPLFTLGAYSPPFLDYIESAGVTTFPTTVFDALRGTSNWIPYLDPASRAGNDLLRQPALIVESGALLLFGLAGIAMAGHRHRLFLGLGTILGLVLVTMGHTGSVEGIASGSLTSLLDGPLAPLRNVHKFDPVIRLCLTLGLALFVESRMTRLRRSDEGTHRVGSSAKPAASAAVSGPRTPLLVRVNAAILVGAAALGVAGAALPVATERVAPSGGFLSVPDYWSEAADWLGEAAPGTTLLVPGSSFGTYVWGAPRDEPMQWLARSPWAVRNAVPLTPPGNIRMLDEIERRINSGDGSPALSAYLRRAGIRHLLVRNDLTRSPDITDPVIVHQALARNPDLRRVASFGPMVGGEGHIVDAKGDRIVINGGWQDEYPALEVFAVSGAEATALSVEGRPVVVGGPEDLADLADLGILEDDPTVLASDASAEAGIDAPVVLTDGLRATERSFGRVHDGRSATLVRGDPRRLSNPTRDYLIDQGDRWATWAEETGADFSASSSSSDANAIGPAQPGQLPFAAVDGRSETEWRSNVEDSPPWWRVDLPDPRAVDEIVIEAGRDDREVVRVLTENRSSERIALGASARRTVRIDDPETSWVKVVDASQRPGHRLALAEVEIEGLAVSRTLVPPRLPATWGAPEAIVLRAVQDERKGCVDIDLTVRCVSGREIDDEEPLGFSRRLTLPEPATYDARVRVRARPGDQLDELVLQGGGVGVSASSSSNPDPRAGPVSAVDGNPGTAWTAGLGDLRPTLRLRWLGTRRITGIRLSVDDDLPARLPTEVLLTTPDTARVVRLDDRGRGRFAPLRTDQLSVVVREAEAVNSLDFDSQGQQLPVGVGEIRLTGLGYPNLLGSEPVRVPCGEGPVVTVGDTAHQTRVEATPSELLSGRSIEAELCGSARIELPEGETRVSLSPTPSLTPTSLVLGDPVSELGAPAQVGLRSPDPTTRELGAAPDGTLVVKENTNPGWGAESNGTELAATTVDGWQQGWRGDDAMGPVTVRFVPDRFYRLGLLSGLLALLVLVVLTLRSRRWRNGVDAPELEPVEPGPIALTGVAVGSGLLIAGWIGGAVALGVMLVARALLRRAPEVPLALIAVALVPAVVAYVLRPWGGDSGWAGAYAWPHYCALAAALVPLVAAAPDRGLRHGGGRFFKRRKGRSTAR